MQVSSEVFTSSTASPFEIQAASWWSCTRPARYVPVKAALLCFSLVVSLGAFAQNPPSVPTTATDTAKPIPTVVTTVEVKGKIEPDYAPETSTVGGYEDVPLKDTPHSVLVVTRGVMDDQQARVLSDITKNDASIGENYAPVGYYPDFQIRGFPIDLATGLKINGLTIAGEQLVPLENKQNVEFLKGLSSLATGVSSPGGLINFITKRPVNVGSMTLATDQRGSALGVLDFGRLFGKQKQFGLRTNVGGESIRSYVNGADGSRGFGTISADWQIDFATKIRGDFEYQHQVQPSVAGYQLLGGITVPTDVFPSTMLGEQSWAKPNTFDAFNTSVRLDHSFGSNWTGYVTAGRSWSLIDDNIAYPYGCYYEDACNSGAAPYPWFFSPTGDYDVYDYRSPGELRIDDQFQAIVSGLEKTGFMKHNIVFGTNLLRRSVALPSAVFDFVGTDNVFEPLTPFAPSPNSPGPASLQEDSHQYGIVVQDRIDLPGHFTISVGGQIDTLHDHNFSNIDPQTGGQVLKATERTLWLPQYSVAFHPFQTLTFYGSYGKSLSLGPQAPFWALNGSVFLDPYFTRQAEVGAKFQPNRKLLVSASLFRMRAPYFYTKPTGNGLEFVSEGHETHRGAEISVQGTITKSLRLVASTAAIAATPQGTGTPEFENKQVINQPRMRATLLADLVVPHVKGLAIMPGWSYTGRKAAARDDTVSVGGYNLFSAGLRYTPRGESRVTFRLYADNITNKRYWKDTGASLGDTFLHVGAPTTVRLSTQFSF